MAQFHHLHKGRFSSYIPNNITGWTLSHDSSATGRNFQPPLTRNFIKYIKFWVWGYDIKSRTIGEVKVWGNYVYYGCVK